MQKIQTRFRSTGNYSSFSLYVLTIAISNAPGGAKICGKLYKEKLANGTKGKCIEYETKMLTPCEFEKACNLGNSRDWRRSIHFAGDHIKVLIKCKILNVHAQVAYRLIAQDPLIPPFSHVTVRFVLLRREHQNQSTKWRFDENGQKKEIYLR